MTSKENIMLDILDREMKSVNSLSLTNIEKFRAVVKKAPVEALEAIIYRHIPFINTLANTELVRRGIRPESALMDHAVNMIAERITA